ncbi:MAG: hypothetical protein Q3980_16180 [Turicibacter sp.]|nr:hypothetical protein [Turicibacter sp.]MDO5794517.1 hypothetical protein [Turicibacter sp.]
MLNSYFYMTMTNDSIVCQQNALDDNQILRAIFLVLSRFERDPDLKMARHWMLESEKCSLEELEQKFLEFKRLIHDQDDSELLLEFDTEKINVKAKTKLVGMFCSIAYLYTNLQPDGIIKKNLHHDMMTHGIDNIKRHLDREGLKPYRIVQNASENNVC